MKRMLFHCLHILGTSDFEGISGITVSENRASIRLFTTNDQTTLEYNDTVILKFTTSSNIIQLLEAQGEYLRDTATVNIVDNDSKSLDTVHSIIGT